MAWTSRQPATAAVEEQIVPTCATSARSGLGAWETAHVITENISIEAGVGGKQKHQAASIVVDNGDDQWSVVHMKKQRPWLVAAVGGPHAKKGELGTVHVVQHMFDKAFGLRSKTQPLTQPQSRRLMQQSWFSSNAT